MKKYFKWLTAAALVLLAVSCSTVNDENGNQEKETISSIINGSTTDLSNVTINESVTLTKSKTLKNGNFNGNTLTVDCSNVTLENLSNVNIVISENAASGKISIKNCASSASSSRAAASGGSIKITVKGSARIQISDCAIDEICVKKENAVLKFTGTSNSVSAVSIESPNVNIASETKEEMTISNIEIAETVPNISISGAKIIELKTENSSLVVTVQAGTSITKTSPVKVSKVDDSVELPSENVTQITISKIELIIGETAKKEYEIGDIFDFTGITAKITYSDSSTTNVALNADNTKVSGFNSSVEGSCTVKFEYSGKELTATLGVTIKQSTKEYKKLIDEGFTSLANGDFDAGVQKFSKAYKSEANDETALYYALAELATISTEDSVKDIIKNNFGITSYPSTLNALFSDEWVKKYQNTNRVSTYSMTETTTPTRGYVRVSGTPTSGYSSNSKYFEYCIDDDGDVIEAWEKYNYPHIMNCTLDENGEYFVSSGWFKNEELKGVKVYDINYAGRKKILVDRLTIAPEFAVPEWLSKTEMYQSTILKSTQTVQTLSVLMLGNIIDLNPYGANELIDKVLAVFDGKFSNAKSLAASMSNGTVAVPYNIISTLGLQEILGDSTVYIGKAELNVLISALQILKATFQYLSFYDLSANIIAIKNAIVDTPTNMYQFLKEVDTGKFLTVRNSKAIEESKNTFVESIQTVQDSYNFIVSSESSYPTVVKEQLSYYGQVFYTGAEDLRNCIKEGKVFYIPNDPFEQENPEWSADDSNAGFAVDLGKFFTAGYFTNIVEREADSKFKISGRTVLKRYSSDVSEIIEFEITDDFTEEKFEEIHTAAITAAKEKYPDDDFWVKTTVGYELNYSLITDMFPKMPVPEKGDDWIIVPIHWKQERYY